MGTDVTEATRIAARGTSAVVNFIVGKGWKMSSAKQEEEERLEERVMMDSYRCTFIYHQRIRWTWRH